jgi:sec-independent protein translocase protein TatC
MPVILYQLWQFIAPGLYRRERRYIYLAAPAASILFMIGAAFCYYVMLPAAVPMLLHFVNIPIRPRPANYMSFTINLMFWTGISFETPLIIFFLAKVHLVDYRFLLRNWRIAIFLTAVLAAIITPTVDPINMALVMGPLIVLYFMSIILARIAYNPKKVEEED